MADQPTWEMAEPVRGGKPQKPIYKKWWFWVLAVFLLLGFASALSGDDTGTTSTTASNTTTESAETVPVEVNEEVSDDAAVEPEQTLDSQNLPIGTAYTKKNISVTVLSVEEGPYTYDDKATQKVTVNYVNNSEKDSVSFNPFDWAGEDANGVRRDYAYVSGVDDFRSGELAPGGQVTGDLYFEAPIVKVVYTGNWFWDSETDKIIWIIQ